MRLRVLPSLFLIRRLVRELQGIRVQLTRQADLFARLADHLAPLSPTVDRAQVADDTGVDFVDPIDAALALDYVTRTARDTGHVPTDDEILGYLSDEKTTDLHARLIARDREAERIAAEHRR